MEQLRSYILSVIAAAILCALSLRITGKQGSAAAVMRFVCGMVMAAVVVQPIGASVIPDLRGYFTDLEAQVSQTVALGTENSKQMLAQRIQSEIQTYIQDKASLLGAALDVTVEVDNGELPVPVGVVLRGAVSPSAKSVLSQLIEEELGIGKENQTWI